MSNFSREKVSRMTGLAVLGYIAPISMLILRQVWPDSAIYYRDYAGYLSVPDTTFLNVLKLMMFCVVGLLTAIYLIYKKNNLRSFPVFFILFFFGAFPLGTLVSSLVIFVFVWDVSGADTDFDKDIKENL